MKKLTPKFNEAVVNKGETFEITGLFAGGFVGTLWDIELASGKASKLQDTLDRRGSASIVGAVYRADEAGELEFVATSKLPSGQKLAGGAVTFKVKVV